MVEDSHKTLTSTSNDETSPSNRVRKSRCDLPKWMRTDSNSVSTIGNQPAIHSTAASQATQDTKRSIRVTTDDAGKATESTRAMNRMATSDTSIGKARRSTATGTCCCTSTTRERYTRHSAHTGNSKPCSGRSPSHTEERALTRPCNARVNNQARSKLPSKNDHSSTTPGCRRSSINCIKSFNGALLQVVQPRCPQPVNHESVHRSASTRRCASTLRPRALSAYPPSRQDTMRPWAWRSASSTSRCVIQA